MSHCQTPKKSLYYVSSVLKLISESILTSAQKMVAVCICNMLVFSYESTWHYNSEQQHCHFYHHENLRSATLTMLGLCFYQICTWRKIMVAIRVKYFQKCLFSWFISEFFRNFAPNLMPFHHPSSVKWGFSYASLDPQRDTT